MQLLVNVVVLLLGVFSLFGVLTFLSWTSTHWMSCPLLCKSSFKLINSAKNEKKKDLYILGSEILGILSVEDKPLSQAFSTLFRLSEIS